MPESKTRQALLSVTVSGGKGPSVRERLASEKPAEMSLAEKEILCLMIPESPALPYPLRELPMAYGPAAREYVIPDSDRQMVFESLYPFSGCPDLGEIMYDIHEDRDFRIGDYRVIRERGRNLLVSPYYPRTGGMLVDWIPQKNERIHCRTVINSAEPEGSAGE